MLKQPQNVTSTINQNINQVFIGGEEKLCYQRPNNVEKNQISTELNETAKEIRIRIGTLLKTDNVSFLIGAGCSKGSGGLTLAGIPYEIEKDLHDEGYKGERAAKWLKVFYRCVSACAGDLVKNESNAIRRRILELLANNTFDISKRNNKLKLRQNLNPIESFKNESELSFEDLYDYIIPINLEFFLTRLHNWANGAIESYVSFKFDTEPQNTISVETINDIILNLKRSLSNHCKLPIQGRSVETHRRFIKKILTRPLNLRRVNLFTLNYDTLLEQACDSEGAVIIDGFIGNLRRIFRPESFEQDLYFPAETTEGNVHRLDRVLHLYKLHGSLSWYRSEPSWENPYGLYATFDNQQIHNEDVLIYPTSLKYGQMLGLPYSELFRRFANIIVRPQSVLFVMGYSFGDEHVNVLIRQALAIPSFTLVIVDPDPKNDFIKILLEQKDQRVWVVKGWDIGAFEGFVDYLLPDLREEEIMKKVISTFNALDKKKSGEPPESEEEISDGE